VNGKGYSFNALPHERYDESPDQFLYKSGAYTSGNSIRPAVEVQNGMEMAKKLAEENEAIGGDIEESGLVDTDAK